MTQNRVYPGSTACKQVQRLKYEWKGSTGHIESHVFEKDGKYFRVSYNDVSHPEGSTNSLSPGWERPQEIDGHQYATAFNAPELGPSIINLQPETEEQHVGGSAS